MSTEAMKPLKLKDNRNTHGQTWEDIFGKAIFGAQNIFGTQQPAKQPLAVIRGGKNGTR